MNEEQIKSYAYTQLLAITESWEHNIRLLKEKANKILHGVMKFDEGHLTQELVSPKKLKKLIKQAENDGQNVGITPHTAYQKGYIYQKGIGICMLCTCICIYFVELYLLPKHTTKTEKVGRNFWLIISLCKRLNRGLMNPKIWRITFSLNLTNYGLST